MSAKASSAEVWLPLGEWDIPMRLPSVANLREHWAKKAKRTASQRGVVRLVLAMRLLPHRQHLASAYVVTLTRVSARELDDDNLASAFKAVRDEVAHLLGLDDRDKRLAWLYGQEKAKRGQHSVRIRVEARL